jgi:hypothetical protein
VRTQDDLAVAAGHSVSPDRWLGAFDELMLRVGSRFRRVEPRRRARAFVLGLLAELPRKNCWTIAEQAGDATRVEDRIRCAKSTGLGHLPSAAYHVNTAWCQAASIACDLLAWLRLLALDGDLAKAEPKTLRYKILHTAGRIVKGQRRRHLKIPPSWPWAHDIASAFTRILALPPP